MTIAASSAGDMMKVAGGCMSATADLKAFRALGK
jgi:hypothetical protein